MFKGAEQGSVAAVQGIQRGADHTGVPGLLLRHPGHLPDVRPIIQISCFIDHFFASVVHRVPSLSCSCSASGSLWKMPDSNPGPLPGSWGERDKDDYSYVVCNDLDYDDPDEKEIWRNKIRMTTIFDEHDPDDKDIWWTRSGWQGYMMNKIRMTTIFDEHDPDDKDIWWTRSGWQGLVMNMIRVTRIYYEHDPDDKDLWWHDPDYEDLWWTWSGLRRHVLYTVMWYRCKGCEGGSPASYIPQLARYHTPRQTLGNIFDMNWLIVDEPDLNLKHPPRSKIKCLNIFTTSMYIVQVRVHAVVILRSLKIWP